MNRIILFLKKYYHVIFFLFISSWIFLYQTYGMLALGDFVFPANPWVSLYPRLFSWKDFFLGHSSAFDFVNIIHYLSIFILNKIGFSLAFIQSLFFVFLFFVASYSIYLLLFEILGNIKYKKFIAIIAANFYIFNPYIFTIKLMGYNMSLYAYVFAPLILYLFYKYLYTENYTKNKYFCLIGISFLLAVPSYTSPAYLTWIIFILFFYLLFLFIFKQFNKKILYKSILVILIFFLINSFWIIPTLASGMLTSAFSKVENVTNLGVVDSTSGQSLVEVFRFLGIPGFTANWRGIPYRSYHSIYYTPIFIIISFILLIVGLSFCLFKKRQQDKQNNFWRTYFFSIFLLAIFFIGGTVFLFPDFKKWLFENFSILLLYRKPYEKIGFFLIFSFVGLLAFSLKYITFWLEKRFNKHKKKIIISFLAVILLLINIYSFPFWTKQVFNSIDHPECKISGINHRPDYYYAMGEYFQKDKKIGKILGLPVNRSPISSGVENYKWGYAGLDPIYSFVNTGYILLNPLMPFFNNFYKGIDSNISNFVDYKNNLTNLSTLFGIKKIVLRNDICWQLYGSPNPKQDKDYLENNFLKTASFGELDIYNVPDNNFFPLFYSHKDVMIVNKSTPILEFKKINPTKYIIRVHQAKDNFPLIFLESFHQGWKAYIVKSYKVNKVQSASIENYKILDGNEEDQASREELEEFIEKGWVSTLGDLKEEEIKHKKWENGKERLDYIEKYNIDFISKNFQNSIQNDNLPAGYIWDTWFKKSLSEENHLIANGYANSWWVDVEEVCKTENNKVESFCVRNPDGTYSFELIIEFWPQRLFYLGLLISGITLLGCLGYLGYNWRRKKIKFSSDQQQIK